MDNDEILKAYLRKRKNEKVAYWTLKGIKDVLIRFMAFLNGKEITENLIYEYIDHINEHKFMKKGKQVNYSKHSIYHIESILRKFLIDVNPDFGKLITPKMPKNRKLPKNMLGQEEIEKLINACLTNRDRALISFLYESGARKGELLSIRLENVKFDENGSVVTIPEGKTGSRRIRVIFSASFLRQWVDTHPKKEDQEAFLFCSLTSPYGVLSFTGLRDRLDTLANRAGIGKEIYPHLFRHSRATHLAKHLTEQELKVYLGWTPGSNMAATYVHLSGEDIDPSILRMHGIVVEGGHADSLKVGRCPRCKEINPENFSYCGKCGLPLNQEANNSLETERNGVAELVLELQKADPKLVNILLDALKTAKS
jgi:integrase/recombinase XerD